MSIYFTVLNIVYLLFLLMCAHFVGDFVFQTDTMVSYKNPNNMPVTFAGKRRKYWWKYFMTAHASTQALLVIAVTGNVMLGMFEFVLHFVIDYGKCMKKYGVLEDQFLHLLTKLGYVILVTI